MGTVKNSLSNIDIAERLFFLGYIFYLIRFVWVSTMFPFPQFINIGLILLFLLLVGIKILFFDRYPLPTIFALACVCICSLLIFVQARNIHALFWTFLVIGAKNISIRKFLKVYLSVTASIILLAFCASLIGVIPNLQYTMSAGIRNSFGIIYPTDFAAYIFFLFLVYFYLKGNTLQTRHIFAAFGAAAFVYYFCLAKVDSICLILLGLVYGIQNFLSHKHFQRDKITNLWDSLWDTLGVFVMPLCAVFSILTTWLYTPDNSILAFINRIFTGRLALGKRGFTEYGISLWGKDIEMIGNGGTTVDPENYFFLDSSYVNVLLTYGVIFFAIILIVYVYISYKYKSDRYLLISIALLSINCIIAHHLLSVAYNPFSFLLFMNIQGKRQTGTYYT